jgi:hypothetical protein
VEYRTYVTKVLDRGRIAGLVAICIGMPLPPLARAADNAPGKPAEALYMQLTQVGLDPARVYKVRGAALDRPAIHISLEDGTIAFTQDVMGKITGAFFQGDGEILLTPPNEVERRSMSLFTGMAILEERFATAYFRFNDDVPGELRPDLRQADEEQELLDHFGLTAKNLASSDGMRMLSAFSRMLPVESFAGSPIKDSNEPADRFLHVRLQGTKLGVFDVYYDSAAAEPVMAGQAMPGEGGETYYNVWTSFSPQPRAARDPKSASGEPESDKPPAGGFAVRSYKIVTDVLPPTQIHAKAVMQCEVRETGTRTLFLELSRALKIETLKLNGEDVEYIHNPALEGTELARRGNDLVAVVLPAPTRAGQSFELEFTYGGEVLAEAGSGLLYVGARGTWYPNRGLQMANFDLEFHYPPEWTLVATGKPSKVPASDSESSSGQQKSHWISDRPMPLAGFNLGKYREVTTRAGDVTVETYATKGVERDFPNAPIEVIQPARPTDPTAPPPRVIVPTRPSPTRQEVAVGEAAAQAIEYFAQRFGPFPYSQLALTQMPGRESQGWPGLVFLSSYAFLDDQQREQLHFDEYRILQQKSVPAHETAHQWWGDLVTWNSYRDQWFSEGLSNYCALMMLLDKNPTGFREVMNGYRQALVEKTKDGSTPMDAGPVTLGTRLFSSKFPEAYESINYGRGTWLFHMLRTMLKDAAEKDGGRQRRDGEEPFMQALRKVRQRYEGKAITTRELIDAFAEELPPSLRYEGKKSLDWFLEGWVNGTSVPRLELRSVKFAPQGKTNTVSGTILQKDAAKDLVTSVPIYGIGPGKEMVFLGRVFADGEESTFRITAPAAVRKLALDPNETILSYPKN